MPAATEKTSFNLDTNFITHVQQQIPEPFIARADYISADFITQNPTGLDLKYLNYVRLIIDVPFIEGSFPLISTKPLHNYRLLLTPESPFAEQHACSNFQQQQTLVRYGFVRNESQGQPADYETVSKPYRDQVSLDFYSNLDKNRCGWRFVAYYDISELTGSCYAHIIADSDLSADKSFLTIKIPIHVSYIYPSYQAAWSSIEYKSEIDAFIIYKTKVFDSSVGGGSSAEDRLATPLFGAEERLEDVLAQQDAANKRLNQIAGSNHPELASFAISKISLNREGKLVVEFKTVPSFRGNLYLF